MCGTGVTIDLAAHLGCSTNPCDVFWPLTRVPQFDIPELVAARRGEAESRDEHICRVSETIYSTTGRPRMDRSRPHFGTPWGEPLYRATTYQFGDMVRIVMWYASNHLEHDLRDRLSSKSLSSWPLRIFMASVRQKHKCEFISYNYDMAPVHLAKYSHASGVWVVPGRICYPKFYSDGRSVLVHPHGNIGLRHTISPLSIESFPSRLTLEDLDEMALWCGNLVPRDMFVVPAEIVPPGCVSDLAYYSSIRQQASVARSMLALSDSILCIGLRLSQPDLSELPLLLPRDMRKKVFYHMVGDENGELRDLLWEMGCRYVHVGLGDGAFNKMATALRL